MPIYEFYCLQNHKIYQFYAKTLAQGRTIPPCPDNPAYRMEKILSPFAVVGSGGKAAEGEAPAGEPADSAAEARMEAAMGAMEREFANVDENDPRAMGRMIRRMADLTGEKIGGEMEEMVRKLEEGADPDSLEEELGQAPADEANAPGGEAGGGRRRKRTGRGAPVRDPKLYDYP
ncbi:MAG TPA: FmdB family transcriptional regulator [Opitutaceae bacterium]|jgi:hypothetical protein